MRSHQYYFYEQQLVVFPVQATAFMDLKEPDTDVSFVVLEFFFWGQMVLAMPIVYRGLIGWQGTE